MTRARPIRVTVAPPAASRPPTQQPIAPAPNTAMRVMRARYSHGTRDALRSLHVEPSQPSLEESRIWQGRLRARVASGCAAARAADHLSVHARVLTLVAMAPNDDTAARLPRAIDPHI